MKDEQLVTVRNREIGSVGYTLENNFHREFEYNEVKKVPFGELKQLQYSKGGRYVLNNCLVIEDEEALKLLNMEVEPEYFYNDERIKYLLLTGGIDEFADFLDFAPEGALDIAKDLAVKNKIPDMRKREMLSEKTGLNINNAIMLKESMADEDDVEEEVKPKRRVPIEDPKVEAAPQRKAATPTITLLKDKK